MKTLFGLLVGLVLISLLGCATPTLEARIEKVVPSNHDYQIRKVDVHPIQGPSYRSVIYEGTKLRRMFEDKLVQLYVFPRVAFMDSVTPGQDFVVTSLPRDLFSRMQKRGWDFYTDNFVGDLDVICKIDFISDNIQLGCYPANNQMSVIKGSIPVLDDSRYLIESLHSMVGQVLKQ